MAANPVVGTAPSGRRPGRLGRRRVGRAV